MRLDESQNKNGRGRHLETFSQTSGVDYSERLLESECPKTAAISRFQNSALSQVTKRLFIQIPKQAEFQAAGGVVGVDARLAPCRSTDS
jgi:hypothetical protein